ncbi:MAG: hypothetical protein WEA56_17485, partial [Balneolaceae bacterium]
DFSQLSARLSIQGASAPQLNLLFSLNSVMWLAQGIPLEKATSFLEVLYSLAEADRKGYLGFETEFGRQEK